MKDAFRNKIVLGDKVIYSVKGGGGTEYVIGTVSKLIPCKPDPRKGYYPDRVAVKVIETTMGTKFDVDPILYAANVVLAQYLEE